MGGKQRSVPARPVKKGGHSFLKGPKQAGVKKTKGGKLTSVKNQIRGVRRLLSKVYYNSGYTAADQPPSCFPT